MSKESRRRSAAWSALPGRCDEQPACINLLLRCSQSNHNTMHSLPAPRKQPITEPGYTAWMIPKYNSKRRRGFLAWR